MTLEETCHTSAWITSCYLPILQTTHYLVNDLVAATFFNTPMVNLLNTPKHIDGSSDTLTLLRGCPFGYEPVSLCMCVFKKCFPKFSRLLPVLKIHLLFLLNYIRFCIFSVPLNIFGIFNSFNSLFTPVHPSTRTLWWKFHLCVSSHKGELLQILPSCHSRWQIPYQRHGLHSPPQPFTQPSVAVDKSSTYLGAIIIIVSSATQLSSLSTPLHPAVGDGG